MHADLADLANAAAALAHEWALPQVADDGDCLTVTPRLAEHLDGETVTVWGWLDADGKLIGFVHMAVRVGDFIVDATATQFAADLPMPWVLPQARYCDELARATHLGSVTITPELGPSTAPR